MTSDDAAGSSRREFLTGRALQSQVERAGSALAEELAREDRPVPVAGHTVRLGTRAMACDFVVVMNPGPARQVMAASDALDLVHRLEDQMSVYREHSELSVLNRRAVDEPVEVEPQLFDLLLRARQIALDTQGAFDPTSGPLIALWRRCRQEGRLPGEEEIDECRERMGVAHVQLECGPPSAACGMATASRTVRFDRPGIELNLGGIGKGYALDRAGELLKQEGLNDWLIHGGHSSLLAAGRHTVGQVCNPPIQMTNPPYGPQLPVSDLPGAVSEARQVENLPHGLEGWPVGIRNPLFPRENLATLLLKDQALSSSGSGVQHFRHGGRRYGHILDPRTGRPAEGLLSVTVLAPTAAEADALSTAFFVLGVEKARAYCDNRPEVQALLIPPPHRGRRLEPIVCGIPGERVWMAMDAGL